MRNYFTKCTSCVVNYVSYDVIIPTNQIPKEQRISDVSVWSQTRTITQTRDHKPAPNGQKQGIKV